MIFGFGKNKQTEDLEEEVELVLFQGAYSGEEVDISEHAKLAQVGLLRAKELVTDALERRAERMRIEPKGERSIAQMFIDGVGYAAGKMNGKEGLAVTQVLKLVGGMDVKERRKPQTGGIHAEFDDRKYLLMLSTKPLSTGGERLVMDIVDVKNAKYSPTEMGWPQEHIDKIRELTTGPGVVIVAGPPNSGTTTTAFAVLRGIDAYVHATFCLIDMGHRELGSVTQFDRREGEDLETALTRLIRMEGDIAFVEPLDNEDVVKQVLDKSEDLGIISEMTARDASSAIQGLCKLAGNPALVAERLRGVFSQKLIRKLCTKCKQPYRPNPKLVQKVGLPETVQVLYKPPTDEDGQDLRVCKRCGGSGYLGRTVMLELIEVTPEVKEAIAAGKDASAVKVLAREAKMLNFKDEGLRLVGEGITSLEELQRVFRS